MTFEDQDINLKSTPRTREFKYMSSQDLIYTDPKLNLKILEFIPEKKNRRIHRNSIITYWIKYYDCYDILSSLDYFLDVDFIIYNPQLEEAHYY